MPTSALILLNQPSAAAPPHRDGAPTFQRHDPDEAALSALDLGATRGDGIFETISIGSGHPQALDHHLRRFARSAEHLELPLPDEAAWRRAISAAVAAIDPTEEAWVKIVLTRGVEGDGRPTGWVYAAPSPDYGRERADGIRVVSLDRGYRHDVARTSPWLLAGAKTISYAVNRAVLREAVRRGAEDVIFVSSDGYVLEGPSSTVVYRVGDSILTPGPELGILDGTTQASIFRFAEARGQSTGFELLSIDALAAADAVWLVSSLRLAVPVVGIDDRPIAVDAGLSAELNAYLKALRD